MRIWDYSDPADPNLASTLNTGPQRQPIDARVTRGPGHDVVDGTTAYVSWYSDGVVIDVKDPYDPVEVARHTDSGSEFEGRDGGFYVLREHGSGSAKAAQAVTSASPEHAPVCGVTG